MDHPEEANEKRIQQRRIISSMLVVTRGGSVFGHRIELSLNGSTLRAVRVCFAPKTDAEDPKKL